MINKILIYLISVLSIFSNLYGGCGASSLSSSTARHDYVYDLQSKKKELAKEIEKIFIQKKLYEKISEKLLKKGEPENFTFKCIKKWIGKKFFKNLKEQIKSIELFKQFFSTDTLANSSSAKIIKKQIEPIKNKKKLKYQNHILNIERTIFNIIKEEIIDSKTYD